MEGEISARQVSGRAILELARGLRELDRQELQAVCDLPPLQAVRASVLASDVRFLRAWYAGETLLAIGGCSPGAEAGAAAPWLLGTEALDAYLYTLTRTARAWLRLMAAEYPRLSNVIDARQARTVRWLQGLGFKFYFEPPRKAGYALWRFVWEAEDVRRI